MGTLLAREYAGLSELDPAEARFLGVLLPDLLREATREGSARLAFHEYDLRARSEPLGKILITIAWEIRRQEVKIAGDTAIQFRRPFARRKLARHPTS